MIRFEHRTRSILVGYVDRLGRVCCAGCSAPPFDRVELQRRDPDFARCDLCGADAHTVERVTEQIEIEYVTCKVF